MSNVVRLPKQHKKLPHCARCKRELPTFDSMHMNYGAERIGVEAQLEAITFHVWCACGLTWNIRRGIKAS